MNKSINQKLNRIKLNLKHSFGVLGNFLSQHPKYLYIALAIGLVIYIIMFWAQNLQLLGYILSSSIIPLDVKIHLLSGTFTSIFSTGISWILLGTLIVSLIQGILISEIMFIIKKQRQFSVVAKSAGGIGITSGLATFSMGCSACGTSIASSVLLAFGVPTATSIATAISYGTIFISLIVSIISLYFTSKKLGQYLV